MSYLFDKNVNIYPRGYERCRLFWDYYQAPGNKANPNKFNFKVSLHDSLSRSNEVNVAERAHTWPDAIFYVSDNKAGYILTPVNRHNIQVTL